MMTKDELEQLSDDELIVRMKKLKNDAAKLDVMQLGLKVTLNSAYGMIGNEFSRYFDTRIAEGITVSGQLSIRWIERKLYEYLNKACGTEGVSFAVAGDTDSIYITLAPLVEKFFKDAPKDKIVAALDKLCEVKIQPIINAAYEELADYMNAYEQKMFMAREVIADRGLWRAKKNYALNVWNSEGVAYSEPKLKVVGLESTRSSTPEMCRNAISDSIKLIMTAEESDIQVYIAKFKELFYGAAIEDISHNTGVKDIDKWACDEGFISKTPYHVKGAMVFNRLVEEMELTGEYKTIRNGDKAKLIYLKKANPTHNNTITYPDILPPEFDLHKYVDKKTQWHKKFLDPVNSLLKIIGWSDTKKNTLW